MAEIDEPDVTRSALDFTPLRAVVWMLGAVIVILLLAIFSVSLSPGTEKDPIGLAMMSSAAFIFVAGWLLAHYPAGPSLVEGLALQRSHPLAIPLGGAIGLLSQIPANAAQRWMTSAVPQSAERLEATSEMMEMTSSSQSWLFIGVVSLLVPLSEEVFFRGAVYGALRRGQNRELVSGAIVSLGFVACHFDPHQMISLVFFAATLGALRSFSGSLYPALAAHVVFNGAAMASSVLGVVRDDWGLSTPGQVGVSVFLVFLLFVFVRFVGPHAFSQNNRVTEMRIDSNDGQREAAT